MVYEEQPSEQLEKWKVISIREARRIVLDLAKEGERREMEDRTVEAERDDRLMGAADNQVEDRREEPRVTVDDFKALQSILDEAERIAVDDIRRRIRLGIADRREERMAQLEHENAILWRLAHLIGYDSLEAIEKKLAEVRELWG